MLAVLVLLCAAATPALAGGLLKGTFGTETLKAKKRFVACTYVRSQQQYILSGVQGGARKQKGTAFGGFGADPTAGAAFPFVLAGGTASYYSGTTTNQSVWGAVDGVVVTITGYAKGKLSGTLAATLQPMLGGAGVPIQGNVTFKAACNVL
jgi:hypothetical protein